MTVDPASKASAKRCRMTASEIDDAFRDNADEVHPD